ncbi:MAG: hypothetical protein RL376_1107, partial [Verrucomicrobiota bacterium]
MVTSSPSVLNATEQTVLTNLCARVGGMLLQHSAECALVESVTRRLGLALGAEGVEMALMANGFTLSTFCQGRCDTTVRRNLDRGINMHVVTEVQRTMLLAEKGELDAAGVSARLDAISPFRYPRWLVSVMVGLSCAAFARLGLMARDAEANFATYVITFLASGIA